jgi:hypothetical protein
MSVAISIERPNVSLTFNRDSAALKIVREQSAALHIEHNGFLVVPGSGRGADFVDVVLAVATGQVDFGLQALPSNPAKVRMFINGQRFRAPAFSVAGQTVTWGSAFTLAPSDEIEFTYPTGD